MANSLSDVVIWIRRQAVRYRLNCHNTYHATGIRSLDGAANEHHNWERGSPVDTVPHSLACTRSAEAAAPRCYILATEGCEYSPWVAGGSCHNMTSARAAPSHDMRIAHHDGRAERAERTQQVH